MRRLICAEMTQHLKTYDGFLTPATSSLAYKKNENQEPLAMFTGDLMTVNVNLSGLPALVIRSKDSADENNTLLPSGIQIIGKKYGEAELLGVGHIINVSAGRSFIDRSRKHLCLAIKRGTITSNLMRPKALTFSINSSSTSLLIAFFSVCDAYDCTFLLA